MFSCCKLLICYWMGNWCDNEWWSVKIRWGIYNRNLMVWLGDHSRKIYRWDVKILSRVSDSLLSPIGLCRYIHKLKLILRKRVLLQSHTLSFHPIGHETCEVCAIKYPPRGGIAPVNKRPKKRRTIVPTAISNWIHQTQKETPRKYTSRAIVSWLFCWVFSWIDVDSILPWEWSIHGKKLRMLGKLILSVVKWIYASIYICIYTVRRNWIVMISLNPMKFSIRQFTL